MCKNVKSSKNIENSVKHNITKITKNVKNTNVQNYDVD